MATEAPCFPDENRCQSCHQGDVWYVCEDCVNRLLCEKCYSAHASSSVTSHHSLVDIDQYSLSKVSRTECKRHTGFRVKLFCHKCREYLCNKCPYDEMEICPASANGSGKHKPQSIKKVTEGNKEEIRQCIRKADRSITGVGKSIAHLKHMSENMIGQRENAESAITIREQAFIFAARKMRAEVKSTSDKSQIEISKSLESLQQHLENLVNTKTEALGLLSNSVDAEIQRLTPSVVARLTTTYAVSPPEEVSMAFKPAGLENTLQDIINLFGSLAISQQKEVVFVQGETLAGEDPTDCCTIETPSGLAVVEAFGDSGLYYTAPGKKRKKVSKKGVVHHGACASPDYKVVYSANPTTNTVLMYDVKRNSLQMKREVCVQNAKKIYDIRSHPHAGNLLVSDFLFRRITIHQPDMSTTGTIYKTLKEVGILGNVSSAVWSPCGQYIYVSDWGSDLVTRSVMKLRLQPNKVIWRTDFEAFPTGAKSIDGMVYVPCDAEPNVSVLSAHDGSLIKTISCPGKVKEMRKNKGGQIEMVYY